MKIADLALLEVTGEFEADAPAYVERQAQPLDVYPEFNARGGWQRTRKPGE